MKNYSVYILTSPVGKKYVGCTKMPLSKRWDSGRGYSKQPLLFSDIIRYGWNNFEKTVVATGLSRDAGLKLEKELIRNNRTMEKNFGYNVASGGGTDVFYTPERNNKVMEALIKRDLDYPGLRQKTAQNVKERYEKDDELHELLRSKKKHYIVKCVETGIIYPSAYFAEKKTGIGNANIRRACRECYRTAGGFHWVFVEEYIPGKEINNDFRT